MRPVSGSLRRLQRPETGASQTSAPHHLRKASVPWRECSRRDERLVRGSPARGREEADLCREFDSSATSAIAIHTPTPTSPHALIWCDALTSTRAEPAFALFQRAFKDFGLPSSIPTDNGTPFASVSAIVELSKLSVW